MLQDNICTRMDEQGKAFCVNDIAFLVLGSTKA